jgi:tetratricopeptide (TPR) repeat protein
VGCAIDHQWTRRNVYGAAAPGQRSAMTDGEANGRARGATEALSVLHARPRTQRPPISGYAMALLAGHVAAEEWNAAGLPTLSPQQNVVPVGDEAVTRLARLAVSIHCNDLHLADRPAVWSRLESFIARRLPASAREVVRLRELVCNQRRDAGYLPPDIISFEEILEFHRKVHGEDSYLAGLTRTNLAAAHQVSGDFAVAADLLDREARARASRYGAEHPVTLVTRSMLSRVLLLQAEAAGDVAARITLARRALSLINDVRAVRDRLFGITAPNATRSRRYEAHALLLLGELDRARACLEHVLTFDIARDGRKDLYAIGQTHLLLARVHAAQGNRDQALEHAERAQGILSPHIPEGNESAAAAALAREITATSAEGSASSRSPSQWG